jgi:hypothetical protein
LVKKYFSKGIEMQIDCSQAGASEVTGINLAGQTHPSNKGTRKPVSTVKLSSENITTNHLSLDLAAFATLNDKPVPSPTDLKKQLMQQPNTWASCSLEELYNAYIQSQVMQKPNKNKNSLCVAAEYKMYSVPQAFIRGTRTHKTTEQFHVFMANADMLSHLQSAYDRQEISGHFPAVPESLTSIRAGQANIPLQQIKKRCINLFRDEYLIIAQLFLTETLQEKVFLLQEHMLTAEGAAQAQAYFASLPHHSMGRVKALCVAWGEILHDYSYTLAGLYHLAERMTTLSTAEDKDAQKVANLMQTYLEAAIKIVQSRTELFRKAAAAVLKSKAYKGEKSAYFFKPIRHTIILESLQLIRLALTDHMEKNILPIFREREFGYKEERVPKKKNRKKLQSLTASHKKITKKSPVAKPQPIAKPPTKEEMSNFIATTQLETPVLAEEVILLPEQAISTRVTTTHTAEDAITPASIELSDPALTVTPTITPLPLPVESLLPVAALNLSIAPLQAVLMDNPKLIGLTKRQKETYEQIFAAQWKDASGINLEAVKKLVTRLGGQTKGVGGSRTQIIFTHKSVATIEHRHGRDRAGELYKLSVSLLQRGLGIAGFAPLGWEDQLSRTRDLLINFRKYVAKREQEEHKKSGLDKRIK